MIIIFPLYHSETKKVFDVIMMMMISVLHHRPIEERTYVVHLVTGHAVVLQKRSV